MVAKVVESMTVKWIPFWLAFPHGRCKATGIARAVGATAGACRHWLGSLSHGWWFWHCGLSATNWWRAMECQVTRGDFALLTSEQLLWGPEEGVGYRQFPVSSKRNLTAALAAPRCSGIPSVNLTFSTSKCCLVPCSQCYCHGLRLVYYVQYILFACCYECCPWCFALSLPAFVCVLVHRACHNPSARKACLPSVDSCEGERGRTNPTKSVAIVLSRNFCRLSQLFI